MLTIQRIIEVENGVFVFFVRVSGIISDYECNIKEKLASCPSLQIISREYNEILLFTDKHHQANIKYPCVAQWHSYRD